MPCYDPETYERPKRLEQKVHMLTSMLCELCGKLESTNPSILNENVKIFAWWINHKAQDKLVSELEEKRKLHGDKALTPRELGLVIFGRDVSY